MHRHRKDQRSLESSFATLMVLGCLVGIAAVVGCGGDGDTSAADASGKGSTSVSRFAQAMPEGYPILAESPRQMGSISDLVIRGVISGFSAGPVYYGKSADDPGAVASTIMQVKVDQVIEGDLPANANDTVWIELFGMDPNAAEQTGPVGQATLVYLKQLPPTGSVDEGVLVSDPTAGRPADQPSFTPARAQGFMVAAGDDVLQPAMHLVFSAATLEMFMPSRDQFPAPRIEGKNAPTR